MSKGKLAVIEKMSKGKLAVIEKISKGKLAEKAENVKR